MNTTDTVFSLVTLGEQHVTLKHTVIQLYLGDLLYMYSLLYWSCFMVCDFINQCICLNKVQISIYLVELRAYLIKEGISEGIVGVVVVWKTSCYLKGNDRSLLEKRKTILFIFLKHH